MTEQTTSSLLNVRDIIGQINISLQALNTALFDLTQGEKTFGFRVSKFKKILRDYDKSLTSQIGLLTRYIEEIQQLDEFPHQIKLIAQLELDKDKLKKLKGNIELSQAAEMVGEGPFTFARNNLTRELNTFAASIKPTEKRLREAIASFAA